MAERLTNKREADAQRETYNRRIAQGYPRNVPEERFLKLAAYEDTGLEPEEIKEVQEAMNPIPFGRFHEIMEAERDGRCVVLPPVKGADIGNPLEPLKVYAALKSEVLKYDYRAEHEPQKISALDYTIIMALQDVLTRAEAEKALGKEQGHDE